jgi:predicted MFS family arabinose efflux permease
MSDPAPTPDVSKPTWRPGTFRSLRHANYRLYFFGQIVSLTGTWVQTTVVNWLVFELTDSATWNALVNVAFVLPMLLLAVPGGHLADRWPRRPLIFLTQSCLLALALALAILARADRATPVVLVAITLLSGVVNAFDTPVRLAFVIDLVGREDLANAVALNSMVFNVARLAGPALAGLLSPFVGRAGLILLNATSFAAVLAALLCMRLAPRPVAAAEARPASSLTEGFTYLARRPRLVLLLVMAAALAFFNWPLLSLVPAFSKRVLGMGEVGNSWMTAAVGGGALVGALTVASSANRGRALLLVLGVLVGMAALAGMAYAGSLRSAMAWCAASGAGMILFFASGQAALQLGAGEHNRGRIMGVWLAVLSAAQPAGSLTSGYLADRWDLRSVLLLDAAGVAVTAAVVSLLALLSRPTSAE